MNCHRFMQSGPCQHISSQQQKPCNLAGLQAHQTYVDCRKRVITPHSYKNPQGFSCYISSMEVTMGHYRSPGRINSGAQCNEGQPTTADTLNWSFSRFSRNAGERLRGKSPNPIFVASLKRIGVQRLAPVPGLKAIESGLQSEERMEGKSKNPVLQSRAAEVLYTAEADRMVSSPNSPLATCSGNSAAGLPGWNFFDPILALSGSAAINDKKSGTETMPDGHNEPTHEAGDNCSASRSIGRRTAMLIGGSTLWTSLGCCKFCQAAAEAQDWNYGGPCGPAKWEGLCTSGSKQSPIDITRDKTEDGGSLGVLSFVYGPSTPSIRNTGHGTIEVRFANASNILKVRGHTLQLLQFHFHAPSEHAFNGERYPMEAHLVHRDPVTRKLVVVGVMLDAGEYALPNKCLAASLAYVPQEHGSSVDAPIQLSPSFLLPPSHRMDGSRGYVHYGGSLTMPPCSEDVEWFLLDTPVKISSAQVLNFMEFSGDGRSLAFNSRPLQPLGDRAIFKGP